MAPGDPRLPVPGSLRRRRFGAIDARHGVVIGEGDWVQSAGSRLGNNFSWRKGPIRVVGVEMQICPDREGGIHPIAVAVSGMKQYTVFCPVPRHDRDTSPTQPHYREEGV